MPVQLAPGNVTAYELARIASLGRIGELALTLRTMHLSEWEAAELSYKLDVIGTTHLNCQSEDIDRKKEKADVESRAMR